MVRSILTPQYVQQHCHGKYTHPNEILNGFARHGASSHKKHIAYLKNMGRKRGFPMSFDITKFYTHVETVRKLRVKLARVFQAESQKTMEANMKSIKEEVERIMKDLNDFTNDVGNEPNPPYVNETPLDELKEEFEGMKTDFQYTPFKRFQTPEMRGYQAMNIPFIFAPETNPMFHIIKNEILKIADMVVDDVEHLKTLNTENMEVDGTYNVPNINDFPLPMDFDDDDELMSDNEQNADDVIDLTMEDVDD